MKHRREIDGLRALAILPVMFFHAGFNAVPGGFFGVDIFFVISGFLITGIIVNELHARQAFSIVGFYERRARRIMPALFTVMIAMMPVGWVLLFSDQFKNFMQSLVSINLFVSNYFFLGKSGYFDPEIDLNPMLHTWSLAIEEQFYVFFPLLLWLLWKLVKERYWIPVLSVLGVASLIWANFNWYQEPTPTFYLLQFRAWELIAGAIAAIHLSKRERAYSSQTLSLLGLALIVVAVIGPWTLVGKTMQDFAHPGFITLVPIVGTALILLFAGAGTLVNRLLSLKFFVGIGLISYSAYLWHQPIFAFFKVSQLRPPTPIEFLPLIALTLLLAWASWKFIENPFRNRNRFTRRQIFVGVAAIMVIITGVSYLTTRVSVEQKRVSLGGQSLTELTKRLGVNRGLNFACSSFHAHEPKCESGANPQVLLWGDSYAMHLALALKNSPTALPFVQQTMSGCSPTLGLAQYHDTYGEQFAKQCIKENDNVLAWLGGQPNIKYVVLASPWSTSLTASAKVYNRAGVSGPSGQQGLDSLRATVAAIKALGKKPVIVLATPADGQDHGACAVRALANGVSTAPCDFLLKHDHRHAANQLLVDAKVGAPSLWLDPMVCPNGTCSAVINGTLIFRDGGHLSKEGSTYIGKKYDLMGQLTRLADRG